MNNIKLQCRICKKEIYCSFWLFIKVKLCCKIIVHRKCESKLAGYMINKLVILDEYSEREERELYLATEIDDYGLNAMDQGIIDDIDDPDFWEKVERY